MLTSFGGGGGGSLNADRGVKFALLTSAKILKFWQKLFQIKRASITA